MKKILALILSAVLILGVLAGCGKSGKFSGDLDAMSDSLEGKWTTTIEMSDFINDQMAAGGMDEILTIRDFSITFNLELKSNGTYVMSVDENAFARSMTSVKDQIKDATLQYLQQMLDAQGLNMSVEDMLAASGTDIDQLMDEAFDESALRDAMGDAKSEGQYRAEDGKLYTSDDVDEAPDDDYVIYTLRGGVLTLDKGNGEVPGEMEQFLPLVFERT